MKPAELQDVLAKGVIDHEALMVIANGLATLEVVSTAWTGKPYLTLRVTKAGELLLAQMNDQHLSKEGK